MSNHSEYLNKVLLSRVYDVAVETPLDEAVSLSRRLGNRVLLKRDDLQPVFSFKLRGAYNKMARLSPEELRRGVIAASAGNHAQGVALAARRLGCEAVIVMPVTTPAIKVDAVRRLGGQVVLFGESFSDAWRHTLDLIKETGYVFIPPFDDPDVIAGQGTIGLELLKQLPDMDAVIVPVGGGGLISGVAFAIKSLNPKCKVYGVQAAGAASMKASLEQNGPHSLTGVSTFADGIAVKCPGDLTYELCSKYVDDVVTVSDDETATAILALIEQQKLITEGAGAVAVAAAMFNKVDVKGKKVACILSGGNIDVTILSKVINRGLMKAGRSTELIIEMIDKPGQLKEVSALIADLGANVVSVHHDRGGEDTDINGCYLRIAMETRNWAHVEQIEQAISDAGYHIVHRQNIG